MNASRWISNLSIKNKMIFVILFVAVISILLGFTIIIIRDIKNFRNDLVNDTMINAKLTGEYCISPLTFFDKDGARDVLYKLRSLPNFQSATLYDENSIVFAFFNKKAGVEKLFKRSYERTKNIFKDDSLHVYHSISYKKRYYGTIYIIVSTDKLVETIKNSILLIAMIFFVLIVLAYFLAVSLQKIISEPILQLADVTKRITDKADYSLRVKKEGSDEVSLLYDRFNNMIEQIAIREKSKDEAVSALRSSEERSSAIISAFPDIMIIIKSNGIITDFKIASSEFLISPVDNIIGSDINHFVYKIKNIEEINTLIANTLSTSELNSYNFQLNTIDGIKNYEARMVPYGDFETLWICRDVTEFLKKDQLLRQAQKMETVGNLAGGLAHDFNNVIGGITGTISLLKFKISKGKEISQEKLKDSIEIIEQSADRAADMVRQLLTLSRKHELHFASIDLNNSVKNVLNIGENSFDKSVEFSVAYSDKPVLVNADPTQMEQVILNLCVNASHAMTIMRKKDEHKGGKISISFDVIESDKYFSMSHPGAKQVDYHLLRVSDTGIGMDSETIANIFNPFFSTKDKGVGSGLGLSMVYNIIKQHSGFIDVYSEEGKGSYFNIYLPVLKNQNQIIQEVEEDIEYGSGLVLVIDDEDVIRKIAGEILEQLGYDVVIAEDGIRGIEIYKERKNEIDLVPLDMAMPKLSGKETYIELKKNNPSVRVLMTSGFKFDERVQDALDLGVNGFVQKPYSIKSISREIKKILE